MCLDYGTPHRYRLGREGSDLPLHCEDRVTLTLLLRNELRGGAYDDTSLYHPLLKSMLTGLAYRYYRLPNALREPNYPFCDLIQCVGLLFGFVNGLRVLPSRRDQDLWATYGNPGVHASVYTINRILLRYTLEPWVQRRWSTPVHDLPYWQQQDGAASRFMILLMDYGLCSGTARLRAKTA